MIKLNSCRDVAIFAQEDVSILVAAVDSCGGIGNQSADVLSVSPEIVGELTARVALLEVLAAGAVPNFASVAVCNDEATANLLISGAKITLGNVLPMIISTEKNMKTTVTGLGITVVGSCKKENLRIACAKPGDVVYCAGLPLVGKETQAEGVKLFEASHMKTLLENPVIHTIIPVGSRGVAAESQVLAAESNLKIKLYEHKDKEIDLYKSAGPSSCALFTAEPDAVINLNLPLSKIGILIK